MWKVILNKALDLIYKCVQISEFCFLHTGKTEANEHEKVKTEEWRTFPELQQQKPEEFLPRPL